MSLAQSRIDRLRATLSESAAGCFIARDVANVSYLTAFVDVWDDEPAALVIVSNDACIVLTDSRYVEVATSAALGGPCDVRLVAGDLWTAALDVASPYGQVAVESSLPYHTVERLRTEADILPVSGWVEAIRIRKDDAELGSIRRAQEITDLAFEHILGYLKVGMTEERIALELEVFMRTHGSTGLAFTPIVASGPNSALPHAHPGRRALEPGDFVTMDFGARVDGYCADMTRTIVMGSASAEQRAIYDAVLAANLAGISGARAGLTGAEIDSVARSVIAERGYGRYFGHGLGHGVGLLVHEAPRVGATSTEVVPLGSVITIEPGIYIEGMGGVRIEDLAVVEEGGVNVLTRSPKDLIEL